MTSDSDTDDGIKINQFLEAADTTLLNNSMFERKKVKHVDNEIADLNKNDPAALKRDLPKSQRYILEDDENSWKDFHLPESVQKHLTKKLNEILSEKYEFSNVITDNCTKVKKYKDRIKLLKGADCYVNTYEDIQYDTKGPANKPVIKRRMLDEVTDYYANKEDALKLIAIDGNFILSGEEVKMWAKKRERKDKVFYYKMASNGILHANEEINEFTELEQKDMINENKKI